MAVKVQPQPAGSGSAAPTIVAAGNLGASRTETVAAGVQEWLTGTLNANHALTANLGAGSLLKLLLTQDATGGRTLTVNGVGLTIPTAAGAVVEVDLSSDGTDTFIAVVGPGAPGANGTNGTNGTNGAISGIQDEGTDLAVRAKLNFAGAGVTATDDAAGGRTLITIPGGGGGAAALDCCRVHATAVQSLANTGDNWLIFDAEDYDTAGFHESVTNPTRLTAPVHGIYEIGATCEYASNSSGKREMVIAVNRTTALARDGRMAITVASNTTRVTIGGVEGELQAGDYVEVSAGQNSAVALNTVTGAGLVAGVAAWISLKRAL